ncbi:hypothetical protein C8F04DRAFT_1190502 [Mycena alexandri]|uniref:Uncharacterized protein n=1 Tax=Mycena alexandri TaxID=1745969 RepID=A0AAD6WTD2_9AGAR|nr:hypothetical protein C8F04DRAFT_1190502 [Mycena alexandri]
MKYCAPPLTPLGVAGISYRYCRRIRSVSPEPALSDHRASNMARTKHVYVKSDRIAPPGGWPAHVKVLPPKQPRVRPYHTMQARRADPTVDVDTESDSEKDEPETDDTEDDGDVESQDADEEDSAEDGSDEEGSDVESDSESQPGEHGIEEVEGSGVEGEDMDVDDGSLSSLSSDNDQPLVKRFLTERFDGAHLLTAEEVAVICGVDAESLPHASSLPPLFCASLAVCSDFSQTFAERFPGVHLIQAEEFALISGVNVDTLAPFSSLPPIFRELGRPFSEHNPALRLYNASEAAFLCGSSLEDHSSVFRQAVAASDEQRRRADATRALNATRRQDAIASATRRRSSRFQATVGLPTSSQLDSISTADTANTAKTSPPTVKPSSPLMSAESTLSSLARTASPAMDLDAVTFVLPTTEYCDIQDPEPPSMDADLAPQSFITLWPQAMPLESGMLAVFARPYSIISPSLMIHA